MYAARGSVLDEHHRLRRRYLEASATTHVLAREHIVDTNHIVARLLELGSFVLIDVARSVLLFRPLHPAHVIVVPLPAMRTGKARGFCLLFLVENISFVH